MFNRFADWLIKKADHRPPDFIIEHGDGNLAVRRWYLIRRNRWFNIYLHEIIASDDARALHDHPWWNCSIILRGGYDEVRFSSYYWETVKRLGRLPSGAVYDDKRWRSEGDIIFRRAHTPHRLILAPVYASFQPGTSPTAKECWSLFITGPTIRDWGFWCAQGWRHYKAFVKMDGNKSGIGKGCA